eukprot:1353737-Pyramimonas_sp.AAC.1
MWPKRRRRWAVYTMGSRGGLEGAALLSRISRKRFFARPCEGWANCEVLPPQLRRDEPYIRERYIHNRLYCYIYSYKWRARTPGPSCPGARCPHRSPPARQGSGYSSSDTAAVQVYTRYRCRARALTRRPAARVRCCRMRGRVTVG